MKKDKKQEEKKENKNINMPTNEEDLSRLIEELSKDKNTRISIRGFSMKLVKNEWLNILIYLGINLLLLTASFCIFRPVESETHWFLVTFILLFTFFDYLFKFILYKYFQKIILLSASLIFIVQDIICLALSALPIIFLFEVKLINTWLLIGSLVIFLIVRFILMFLLRRKRV